MNFTELNNSLAYAGLRSYRTAGIHMDMHTYIRCGGVFGASQPTSVKAK